MSNTYYKITKEQASSLSVLKSKVNNTSHVNSHFSKPSSSKISTGPKVKPSILSIKKLFQFAYQENSNKMSQNTGDSDVNHPASISDENDECSTQINIQMKMMNAVLKST